MNYTRIYADANGESHLGAVNARVLSIIPCFLRQASA